MGLKPVRGWRAWYRPDHFKVGFSEKDAKDLPDGIQVVVAFERWPYTRNLANSDWYWWAGDYAGTLGDFTYDHTHPEPGQWVSPQPILDVFPDAVLKRGVWSDLYEETWKAAVN